MDDATLEALAQALYLDAYPDVSPERINESMNWKVAREEYLQAARIAAEFLEAHAPREYGARMLNTRTAGEIVVAPLTERQRTEVLTDPDLLEGWELVSRRTVGDWEPVVTDEQRVLADTETLAAVEESRKSDERRPRRHLNR